MIDRVSNVINQLQARIEQLEALLVDRQFQIDRLTASKARFRAIVENANDTIATMNTSSSITYLSPKILKLLGQEASELIGTSFEPLVRLEDVLKAYASLQSVLTTEEPYQLEHRLRRWNGEYRYCMTNTSLLYNEHGEPSILGISRDVTEQKRLEEDLRQSPQFLNSVIDNIPLGFFAKDVRNDYRYVLVNKCAEQFTEFSPEQGLGLNDDELLPKDLADYYRKQDQAIVQQRVLIETPEVSSATSTGEPLLAPVIKFPLFADQGNLTHLLQPLGFVTQTANNGQEAIALWQTWQPDLIWTDMRMPIMDGYEATQQAAIAMDGDQLLQLVAEIPPDHSDLANELRDLINRFNFDEILELIGDVCDA